jgi:hypothetical protein
MKAQSTDRILVNKIVCTAFSMPNHFLFFSSMQGDAQETLFTVTISTVALQARRYSSLHVANCIC